MMSIIGWLILGLIAGFIASKIVNKTGAGFFLDIVLGIVGALVGGFIFTALGTKGITGVNIYSMLPGFLCSKVHFRVSTIYAEIPVRIGRGRVYRLKC